MLNYPIIKWIHIAAISLSILLMLLRGWWMASDSPLLQSKIARFWPHVIDTVLLVSAIALCLMSKQYPFVHDWLTSKVIALVAYIMLGYCAIKGSFNKVLKLLFFGLAMLLIFFIISVAKSKTPSGFLYWLV